MATIWITYSWEDNKNNDVDFIAQEIERAGLTVKLDRWNIQAGKRLWEQIEKFIQDPSQCDAWLLVATQNSLGSEPCKEEYAYALDRALKTRGGSFPVIGLFPSSVDTGLIPAGIRTRLYVSTQDPDWKERIKAAAENKAPEITRPIVQPYSITVHKLTPPDTGFSIEVRPRAGTWSPFIAAIPAGEKDKVKFHIMHGSAGRPVTGGILWMSSEGTSGDGKWAFCSAQNEATPTMSYYINCAELPSKLIFGKSTGPQYEVDKPGK